MDFGQLDQLLFAPPVNEIPVRSLKYSAHPSIHTLIYNLPTLARYTLLPPTDSLTSTLSFLGSAIPSKITTSTNFRNHRDTESLHALHLPSPDSSTSAETIAIHSHYEILHIPYPRSDSGEMAESTVGGQPARTDPTKRSSSKLPSAVNRIVLGYMPSRPGSPSQPTFSTEIRQWYKSDEHCKAELQRILQSRIERTPKDNKTKEDSVDSVVKLHIFALLVGQYGLDHPNTGAGYPGLSEWADGVRLALESALEQNSGSDISESRPEFWIIPAWIFGWDVVFKRVFADLITQTVEKDREISGGRVDASTKYACDPLEGRTARRAMYERLWAVGIPTAVTIMFEEKCQSYFHLPDGVHSALTTFGLHDVRTLKPKISSVTRLVEDAYSGDLMDWYRDDSHCRQNLQDELKLFCTGARPTQQYDSDAKLGLNSFIKKFNIYALLVSEYNLLDNSLASEYPSLKEWAEHSKERIQEEIKQDRAYDTSRNGFRYWLVPAFVFGFDVEFETACDKIIATTISASLSSRGVYSDNESEAKHERQRLRLMDSNPHRDQKVFDCTWECVSHGVPKCVIAALERKCKQYFNQAKLNSLMSEVYPRLTISEAFQAGRILDGQDLDLEHDTTSSSVPRLNISSPPPTSTAVGTKGSAEDSKS
ncbi:hypothetical protein BJ508DRAFT_365756 [Ascobolus immersus RN42]|uniref:Uncharacterized protein n=1 Tax=Ascobolus immersus RN42 TaxID=1160509 RepID=A0A3N4HN81_ASCIM|nr:hypothetical protein BJ508DRAFT_365756 [Ascobolus immersus RN42]